VGGPNITHPGDGPIAECVGKSPGNATHVLLSDREAEHIPGCNMAFRKAYLEEIGGFDKRFRVAGDDVDICWRLQQRGWTLGFSPAAVGLRRRLLGLSGKSIRASGAAHRFSHYTSLPRMGFGRYLQRRSGTC
jgi:GT2 family glycosyltransferase